MQGTAAGDRAAVVRKGRNQGHQATCMWLHIGWLSGFMSALGCWTWARHGPRQAPHTSPVPPPRIPRTRTPREAPFAAPWGWGLELARGRTQRGGTEFRNSLHSLPQCIRSIDKTRGEQYGVWRGNPTSGIVSDKTPTKYRRPTQYRHSPTAPSKITRRGRNTQNSKEQAVPSQPRCLYGSTWCLPGHTRGEGSVDDDDGGRRRRRRRRREATPAGQGHTPKELAQKKPHRSPLV